MFAKLRGNLITVNFEVKEFLISYCFILSLSPCRQSQACCHEEFTVESGFCVWQTPIEKSTTVQPNDQEGGFRCV